MDIMMYSQLRGGNQGIIKIVTHGMDVHPEAKPFEIVHETPLSARINGHNGAAMVVLSAAADLAVEKAKKSGGFGICGTYGTCQSTGSLGAYVRGIADQGMIGIAMAQSPEFVAPNGSYEAIFGTNPVAFGIPRGSDAPIVLDMATAAYPFFGLLEAKTAGKEIPEGVAFNNKGEVTRDPSEAIAGAIRGWGGYKGSGLALMVELMAGPLVGAATTDKKSAKNWGNLIMAISPELLGPADEFYAGISTVLGRVKGAKTLPDVSEMRIPGEHGTLLASEAESSDLIEVEANLLKKIEDFAAGNTE